MQEQFSVEILSKKSFLLNGFSIDPLRGELISADRTEQIEPKVMAVLIFLAANHGEVVDPEVLFFHVWPKSIYSPGSIRRCIAVLRKILVDQDKNIIVTHPKRGYSLQATIQLPVTAKPLVRKKKTPLIKWFASATFAMLFISTVIYLLTNTPSHQNSGTEITTINVNKILPLTATEQFEYYSRYSPNGAYIAFLRAQQMAGISHKTLWQVWVKELASDTEYQLSSGTDKIKSFSWSLDSKAVLYATRSGETVNVYRLANKSSQHNEAAIRVLSRKGIQNMTAIHWGIDNQLYYIAKIQGVSSLFVNNLTNGEQKTLLTSNDDFHPYELAITYQGEKLAVLGFNKQMHSQVKVISLVAGEVDADENQAATILATLNSNRFFIDWHPNNQNILLSDGRHLFNLTASGQVHKIGFENFTFARHPQFSPTGKDIAITMENIDQDIWLQDILDPDSKRIVVNSNTSDFQPRFSPSGNKFAFISARKGYPQLYIHDLKTGKNRLVFANPKQNLSVYPAVWHPSGNKIASATNEQPFVIELTEQTATVAMLNKTQGIPLQWYQQEDALLFSNQKANKRFFSKLYINSQQLLPLRAQDKNSAYLNHDNELILISKHTITNATTNKEVSLKQGDSIERSFSANNGLYLQIANEQEKSLYFFSFKKESLNKISLLTSEQYIAAVSQQGQSMLTTTLRIEKDIVILTLAD